MKLVGIIPRNEASTVEVPQNPRSRSDGSAPSDKNGVQGRALSQIRCKCVLFRLAGGQWIAWSRRVIGGLRRRERAVADQAFAFTADNNKDLPKLKILATREFLPTNLPIG
jgi:hypothetical protein